jgi:hypothetical protein
MSPTRPNAQFTDNQDNTWFVRIDVNALRAIRSAHGVDLGKILGDAQQLQILQDDICKLVDIIFDLVREQAREMGVTAGDFGAALSGDSLADAVDAFLEAAIDFLPESKRRILRQIIEANKATQAQAELRIQTAINEGLLTDGIRETMDALDNLLTRKKPNNQPISGTIS